MAQIVGIVGKVDVNVKDVPLANKIVASDINELVSVINLNDTATATALALKANLASPTFTGTVNGVTKSMVGLPNVDNTSDVNKPVSTSTQTLLNQKINTTDVVDADFAINTSAWKSVLQISNVNNTSDVNKPNSTATLAALALKGDDDKFINFKGNKPTSNYFPPTNKFFSGLGFTFSDEVVDELLPIDTNKIFKGTYDVSGSGRIDNFGNPTPMTNKKGYFYSWVRKSDILNLPSSLSIMMFTALNTTNQDVILLDYIAKADFVKGYSQSKTVGSSTLKLHIISDYNGWLLFYAVITTTSLTANNFYTRFYIDGTGTGTLDFVNYTAANSLENVNILLPSITSAPLAYQFSDVEKIDVANSDNIVFVADSYTESEYTLDGKAYIQNVSALTDYQIRNYGKAGDDIIEAINRININQVEFNTSLGIKDFGSKYAVIALYANDSPYRYWNIDMFKENLRNLVQRLRGLGIEPIISSEFFLYNFFSANPGVADTVLMQDIADELNIRFIDVAQTSMNFIKSRENDFWNGSHPTTRTNSVMWKPISDFLQSLPKPKKSIKLFRNRAVESNFATDTLYKNVEERNSKYQEIRVGQSALTDANQIYFDRQSLVTSPISIDKNDEYLKLQNGESVSFARHCLAEITVPYMSENVDYFRVKIQTNDTIFPWIRKKKTPFTNNKGTALKYTGTPTIVIGDVYTINSSNTTINGLSFTVTDNREGWICADARNYAYPDVNATGTLTRTSGTGTSSISFAGVLASFDDVYYTDYAKTYEWEEMNTKKQSDGYFYINNTTKQYVEGDKVVMIIRQTSGFSITDISVEIPKVVGAEKIEIKGKYIEPLVYSADSNIIATRLTDTTANLSAWTQEGTIVASNPIGNAYPRWTNGKVNLTNVNKISQALTYVGSRASQKIQIQVWANYEPAKFTGTDLATSPITLTSYDKTDLFIEIYSTGQESKSITFSRKVGLGFQQILIDTFLPPDMVSPKIRLSGSSLGVDVAYVDVLKYL
tara:strand:+ start:3058 stop:6063 length:3006 start_codon:yes stop_codon:yes gene_type:complete